jgi:ribonuclease P protein component
MKKGDVEAVFRAKAVFTTPHFVIRWRRTEFTFPRASFAFARATGSAVKRNRFKRRLRAVVGEAAAGRGFDAVFSAKGSLNRLTEDVWCVEREKIFRFCAKHSQPSGPPLH